MSETLSKYRDLTTKMFEVGLSPEDDLERENLKTKLDQEWLESKPPLYHVSFTPLPEVLEPRVPVSDGGNKFGEPDIPRVCFSDSIKGCIMAVFPNWQHLDLRQEITVLVYQYRGWWIHLDPPEMLTLTKWVHDAHVTREYWSTIRTPVEKIGVAKVKLDLDRWVRYHPFGCVSEGERDHSPHMEVVFERC